MATGNEHRLVESAGPEVLSYRQKNYRDVGIGVRVGGRILAGIGALLLVAFLMWSVVLSMDSPLRLPTGDLVFGLLVMFLTLALGVSGVVCGVQVQQGGRKAGMMAAAYAGVLAAGAGVLAVMWVWDWIEFPHSHWMAARVAVLGTELALAGGLGLLAWVFWRGVRG